MVELYLSPSCTSCRKARSWLTDHKVNYNEHNIFTQALSADSLREILSKTDNGTGDIISMRSKIFQKLDVDVESLSVNELIDLIEKNPSLLRRPIILDDKRLQIGFNEDDIRAFLPRDYRRVEMAASKEEKLKEDKLV
ncbi:transcriptional regulator Spx [Lactovum miscens]|uniref:Global transcriptional regulator Spx n=1 Tax=Lactovum miscens TaxID=190387 RepID=A0A841CA06_9LACT|nr:transcriptional regulator Spx [Lactovum miscens]MBB5888548.1 regulatory protein spx [Lactovum miscens]